MAAPSRPVLVTAVDAAHWLRMTYNARVHPDTIRQWAARGKLTRHGHPHRAKLDLNEVVEHAQQRGLLGDK